tara:strand:+ start:3332 stop:4390 length:1059 start_codon:yes stop_codon:yes gene_type:complete
VLKNKQPLLDAMVNEINLRKQELKLNFTSLYFGGGTPSLLNKKEITQILKSLSKSISMKKLKEITIEINPEDISYEKLTMYKDLGFNRLSIGIQSLEDKVLKWMNRAHTKKQVLEAISLTKKTGFDNISLDFIYGLPKKLKRNYKKELSELISFRPNHISCYHLTIEQDTYFGHLKYKNKLIEIEEEKSEEEFLAISELLQASNYNHYEISNFAKPGKQSYHNTNYWKQKTYIGIGPSAHSFNTNKRRWNPSNNKKYITYINENKVCFEEETLSEKDLFNEKIMLGLRTEKGVDINTIYQHLNPKEQASFDIKVKAFFEDGLLIIDNNTIRVPTKKWLLSEYISREFFILNK